MFLSTSASAEVAPASTAEPQSEVLRAGYRDEIGVLLRRVKRVVVIRDMPLSAPGHLRCVSRALSAGRAPGRGVRPLARARRSLPDPLAEVARAVDSPRVVSSTSPTMCATRRRCFPVVGGALVHRDESHLTPAFSATLGPFVLQALAG